MACKHGSFVGRKKLLAVRTDYDYDLKQKKLPKEWRFVQWFFDPEPRLWHSVLFWINPPTPSYWPPCQVTHCCHPNPSPPLWRSPQEDFPHSTSCRLAVCQSHYRHCQSSEGRQQGFAWPPEPPAPPAGSLQIWRPGWVEHQRPLRSRLVSEPHPAASAWWSEQVRSEAGATYLHYKWSIYGPSLAYGHRKCDVHYVEKKWTVDLLQSLLDLPPHLYHELILIGAILYLGTAPNILSLSKR